MQNFESVQMIPAVQLQETEFLLVDADQLIPVDWECLVALRSSHAGLAVSAISQYSPAEKRFEEIGSVFDRIFWVAADLVELGRELANRQMHPTVLELSTPVRKVA